MVPESTNLDGIDLHYRPTSYFWPISLEKHLLARVKGAERKALLKRLIVADRLDEIPEFLTRSALTEDERKAQAYIHPSLMGGEFLPDIGEQEVEIARITLRSVTQDVKSVYARREGGRIHYRVVDEYDGMTLSDRTHHISDQPLTLRELETFFDGAWNVYRSLDFLIDEGNSDVESMLVFAAASSAFYPQLGELYERRIASWGRQKHGLLDAED
ncbi:MAG: hypothetical protein ACLQT5_00645 [Steroidobacteraceae bacterium]